MKYNIKNIFTLFNIHGISKDNIGFVDIIIPVIHVNQTIYYLNNNYVYNDLITKQGMIYNKISNLIFKEMYDEI